VVVVTTAAEPLPITLYAQTLSEYVRPQDRPPNFHCSPVVEPTITTLFASR
jgi:hypothetical protein